MKATIQVITQMGMMIAMLGASANAQNLSFGADNFYRSNNVTIQPITFPNLFKTIVAGNLFTPNNLGVNHSAIVISHPAGAVKEQSANLYATKLAEQGFVTIALDLAFFGGSDGEPRQSVAPELYAESFSAAVDYLGLQDFVDRERIGGLGICGSGSYIISAAKIDPRLKAIATSSMYDMGSAFRNGLRNATSPEQRKAIIAAAARQRWIEAAGGASEYGLGTPLTITNESTTIDREFYDFYRTSRGEYTPPGSFPNITTGTAISSSVKLANFYPFNNIEDISPRPLLFISGDHAHSREFSENAYRLAAEPKELLWIPGAGHVDLYDRVDLIPWGRITEFFRTHLSS
ncbi:Alpha/Beta hydrolase protein [Paraphoma chrysanthemicola]|nr:Alpha/Beta hydrolase protein [Paraphoma chrysanthemicola]